MTRSKHCFLFDMTEIGNIFAFAFGIVMVCAILRELKSNYATFCSLAGALVICVLTLSQLDEIKTFLLSLLRQSEFPDEYGVIIFKILGISALSEISVSACKDQQHTALGNALDIFSKFSVIVMSLPIFEDVLDTIGALLG